MQAVTTYDEKSNIDFNFLTLNQLILGCEQTHTKLEINNGRITGALQKHRDYVWNTDGRVNYI